MSTRYVCDFKDCEREAVCRITEERYDGRDAVEVLGLGQVVGRGLDACDTHRTVTHPGWWCRDYEEVLRQQVLREIRETAAEAT